MIARVRRDTSSQGWNVNTVAVSRETPPPTSRGTGSARRRQDEAVGVAQLTPPPDPKRTDREVIAKRRTMQLEAALQEARKLLAQGQLESALDACQQALTFDENHVGALRLEEEIETALRRQTKAQPGTATAVPSANVETLWADLDARPSEVITRLDQVAPMGIPPAPSGGVDRTVVRLPTPSPADATVIAPPRELRPHRQRSRLRHLLSPRLRPRCAAASESACRESAPVQKESSTGCEEGAINRADGCRHRRAVQDDCRGGGFCCCRRAARSPHLEHRRWRHRCDRRHRRRVHDVQWAGSNRPIQRSTPRRGERSRQSRPSGTAVSLPASVSTPLVLTLPAGTYQVVVAGPAPESQTQRITVQVAANGSAVAPLVHFRELTAENASSNTSRLRRLSRPNREWFRPSRAHPRRWRNRPSPGPSRTNRCRPLHRHQ